MVGRLKGWFQENHFKESSNLPGIVPLKCQRIASCVKHGSFAEGRMISECVGVSADDITVMISPLRRYKYPLCFLYSEFVQRYSYSL